MCKVIEGLLVKRRIESVEPQKSRRLGILGSVKDFHRLLLRSKKILKANEVERKRLSGLIRDSECWKPVVIFAVPVSHLNGHRINSVDELCNKLQKEFPSDMTL